MVMGGIGVVIGLKGGMTAYFWGTNYFIFIKKYIYGSCRPNCPNF